MNEQHNNFEDNISQRFENFQQDPPEAVWKNIHSVIAPSGIGKRRRGILWISLSLISLLVVFTGVYLGINTTNTGSASLFSENTSLQNTRLNAYQNTSDLAIPADDKMKTGQTSNQNNTNNYTHTPNHEIPADEVTETGHRVIHVDPFNNVNAFEFEHAGEEISLFIMSDEIPLTEQQDKLPVTENIMIPKDSTEIQEISNIISLDSAAETDQATSGTPEDDYGKNSHIFLGLKYTPGIKHGNEHNADVFSYGGEINVGYERNKWVIQTGIGIEYRKQNTHYKVDYNSWEATGNYQYVTSYGIDTAAIYYNDSIIGYVYRPIFSTELVEVFDSVPHDENLKTSSSYSILNIPLMAGYRWTVKNWGLGLKAGGSVSFLLRKKENDLIPDYENSNIHSLSRLSSERKNTWFSMLLAPEIEYYFTEDISLGLEPWFRYAFKESVINEKTYAERPWSWGLNAGVKIHF